MKEKPDTGIRKIGNATARKFLRVPAFLRLRVGSAMLIALVMTIALARADESVADAIGNRAPTAILRMMPSGTSIMQQLAGLSFIAGYQVIGDPVPIPSPRAQALSSAIKAPNAFDTEKNDEHMRPGVAYRFGTGTDTVDLLVCFSCDKVAVVSAGATDITTTHHITQATRDVLLGLAKELLPADEAIQELPRVRSSRAIPPPAVPVPTDIPKAGQPGKDGDS